MPLRIPIFARSNTGFSLYLWDFPLAGLSAVEVYQVNLSAARRDMGITSQVFIRRALLQEVFLLVDLLDLIKETLSLTAMLIAEDR